MQGLLIGNPVDKSISHRTHPRIFQIHGIKATYEKKLILSEGEIQKLKGQSFDWIAITTPYKSAAVSLVDRLGEHAAAIGAVNMIHVKKGEWIGYNTDGAGCLNAIEKKRSVFGQRVLILGAGGTARAIAYEAVRRGGIVAIYNRTRGKVAAIPWGSAVESLPYEYDILINATSVGMGADSMPIDKDYLIPGSLVMDVIYFPEMTRLLQEALKAGCDIVTGGRMFLEVTLDQFRIVFGSIIQRELVESIFHEEFGGVF